MEILVHDPSILTRRAQDQLLIFTTHEDHPWSPTPISTRCRKGMRCPCTSRRFGSYYNPCFFRRNSKRPLPVDMRDGHGRKVHDNSKHVYEGTFFIMYVSLIGFIQVKSQNQDYSPFETHGFFIIMSVIALPIAVITSGMLFYTNDPLEHTNKKNFSHINYMPLESTFAFSTILAPLSLVLVLFIPSELNWIGYGIICALFVIMVAYNFRSYLQIPKKNDMSNFASHQMV